MIILSIVDNHWSKWTINDYWLQLMKQFVHNRQYEMKASLQNDKIFH